MKYDLAELVKELIDQRYPYPYSDLRQIDGESPHFVVDYENVMIAIKNLETEIEKDVERIEIEAKKTESSIAVVVYTCVALKLKAVLGK